MKMKSILLLIIGFIFAFSLGVVADQLIAANNISFDNTNTTINSVTVQGALEELGEKSSYGTATVNGTDNYTSPDLLSGKTALIGGKKVTGSMVKKTDSGNVTLNGTTTSKSYAAGYYPNAHGAQISPTTLTPSTSGAAITSGTLYKASAAGYAYTKSGLVEPKSGTYTLASTDTGTKSLGGYYNSVNAANVYNKGKTDGTANFDAPIYVGYKAIAKDSTATVSWTGAGKIAFIVQSRTSSESIDYINTRTVNLLTKKIVRASLKDTSYTSRTVGDGVENVVTALTTTSITIHNVSTSYAYGFEIIVYA